MGCPYERGEVPKPESVATPQPPKDAGAVPLPMSLEAAFLPRDQKAVPLEEAIRYGNAREAAVRAGAANPAADAQGVEALANDDAARKAYGEYTGNHPVMHCNRFPAWSELGDAEREKWREKARRLTAAGVNQKLATDDDWHLLGYSYASKQATNCAGCGEYKHTPLRIDAMEGYVCLTCIDKKLGEMLGEFGYSSSAQPPAERRVSDVLRIPKSGALDPIIVYFEDTAPGQGRITIACYGDAWTAAWGAMGGRTVRQFVAGSDADYLEGSLLSLRGADMSMRHYTKRIATAVIAALGGQDEA